MKKKINKDAILTIRISKILKDELINYCNSNHINMTKAVTESIRYYIDN